MVVEFEVSRTFNNSLNIEDPGNTCIVCQNEGFSMWYLAIRTIRGISHILTYGAVLPDTENLTESFHLSYFKMKFNEKKLHKIISGFLNDLSKGIVEARECDIEECYEDFPAIIPFYSKLS